MIRKWSYSATCLRENILKTLERRGPCCAAELLLHVHVSSIHLRWALMRMRRQGWIQSNKEHFYLTKDGTFRARQIIRLHRLWELYLVNYVGIGIQRVHASAEEMEHILTPELERQLTDVLNNPLLDPHAQPIPFKTSELV